jgi:hypothetical protein
MRITWVNNLLKLENLILRLKGYLLFLEIIMKNMIQPNITIIQCILLVKMHLFHHNKENKIMFNTLLNIISHKTDKIRIFSKIKIREYHIVIIITIILIIIIIKETNNNLPKMQYQEHMHIHQ